MYVHIVIIFIAYELSNAQRYLLVEMNDETKSDNELDVPWTQTKTTFSPGPSSRVLSHLLPEHYYVPRYKGEI